MAPGNEAVAGWLLPLLLATDVDNLTSRVRVNLLLSSLFFSRFLSISISCLVSAFVNFTLITFNFGKKMWKLATQREDWSPLSPINHCNLNKTL